MASVVGTYARAFADVVMTGGNHLDPARALQELHGIEALLKESDQLRRVLENPSIPGDRKRAVLDAITGGWERPTGTKFRCRGNRSSQAAAVQRNSEAVGARTGRSPGLRRSANQQCPPTERSRKNKCWKPK